MIRIAQGLVIFLFIFLGRAHAGPVISSSGLEGTLTYEAKVVMPESYKNNIPGLIREQAKHLLGVFEQKTFAKLNNLPLNDGLGALGMGNLVAYKVLNARSLDDGSGWEVTYASKFKLLMRRDVLAESSSKKIQIFFPHDPVNFYVRACTDEKYYEKEYLFYFWNPFSDECRAKSVGRNTVDQIEAQIDSSTFSDTKATPDYNSLRRIIIQHGELRVALLFGFDDKSTSADDEGRQSYAYFQEYFLKHGFQIDRRQEIPSGPFTELIKPLDGKAHYQVHLSMSLSVSDQNNPVVFSRRARVAFETADIVLYVGHSGLGGNLDLEKITRLSSEDPDHPTPINFRNDYQILFIDSCASFLFYSNQYLGVQNHADVVTNGTASFFYTQNLEVKRFLAAFIEPHGSPTWLQILSSTEAGSTNRHFSYLLNVVH